MAESDAQLLLKKRARRRLVGAAVLATLAAVVLPLVMDREPGPQTQNVEVRIPERTAASSAGVPPPPAETAKPADSPPPPAAKTGPGQTGMAVKPAEDAARAGGRADQAGDKKAVLTDRERAAAEKAERERAEKERAERKEKAQREQAEREARAAREQAARDQAARDEQERKAKEEAEKRRAAEQAAKSPPKADGQWVVQLGAFSSDENARQLVARLNGSGVAVFTEKLGTGAEARTRVRAGPFPNREAAEKARERLEALGLKGAVAPR